MNALLAPPFPYYGGKQHMLKYTVPRIKLAQSNGYNEIFGGGACNLFALPPFKKELVNDNNGLLINFYKVLKTKYKQLEKQIRSTLCSRSTHEDARVVLMAPKLFSDVQRAWAVWVCAVQSFATQLDGSWGYDIAGNVQIKKMLKYRNNFTEQLASRLENVQIECTDALKIIKVHDRQDQFFYCDPPYVSSDCGHYKGYTWDNFKALLDSLSLLKGKFLLSSYPSPILEQYTQKLGWSTFSVEKTITFDSQKKGKKKIEVLTANYPILTELPFATTSNMVCF